MQQLSAEAIRRAAHYKEAAREYQRHLIMTSVWEIEKLSWLKSFLQCRQKEQEKDTALSVEEAELFRHMVVDRDAEHASQDLEFVASVQEKEKKTLDRLDSELDELDLLSSDPPDFEHEHDELFFGDAHNSDGHQGQREPLALSSDTNLI
ncbi:hypothetical protein DFH29DRAFT_997955 [Suillus ampliporus]|nr:hypothetical protein DFH29DRAFT_997955 [Suillus ampliporus]